MNRHAKSVKISTNHQTLLKLLFTSTGVQSIIVEDCWQQKVAPLILDGDGVLDSSYLGSGGFNSDNSLLFFLKLTFSLVGE